MTRSLIPTTLLIIQHERHEIDRISKRAPKQRIHELIDNINRTRKRHDMKGALTTHKCHPKTAHNGSDGEKKQKLQRTEDTSYPTPDPRAARLITKDYTGSIARGDDRVVWRDGATRKTVVKPVDDEIGNAAELLASGVAAMALVAPDSGEIDDDRSVSVSGADSLVGTDVASL